MLWVRLVLVLLESISFEFVLGRKIVLPLFLAVVFLLILILIQNIFFCLLELGGCTSASEMIMVLLWVK